jgi:hypothetical protein
MRKIQLILIGLSLCAALPLRAQLFSPESVGGAAFGGLAGALIAGPHHAGAGAAIGAGAGFLLGAVAHEERRPYYYDPYYYPSPYYGSYSYYGPYRGYYSYGPYVYTPTAAYYVSDVQPPSSQNATQAKTEPAPSTETYSTYSTQPSSPMSAANALFGR